MCFVVNFAWYSVNGINTADPLSDKIMKKTKGHPLPVAFEKMVSQPNIWKKLKLSKQTIMNRRVLLGKDQYPKDSTMRAWLKKAGWKLAVVELWTN